MYSLLKNGDFPASYVSLPEGTLEWKKSFMSPNLVRNPALTSGPRAGSMQMSRGAEIPELHFQVDFFWRKWRESVEGWWVEYLWYIYNIYQHLPKGAN